MFLSDEDRDIGMYCTENCTSFVCNRSHGPRDISHSVDGVPCAGEREIDIILSNRNRLLVFPLTRHMYVSAVSVIHINLGELT